MYQNLGCKNVKARKQHACDWCGKSIEKGEEYERQKFLYDGDFYEWHSHLACSRIASAIWDYCDPDEGMDEDQFHEGCSEVCKMFICPDCPEWNKEYEDCDKDESFCLDRMDKFFETHELYKAGRGAYYEIWKCREKKRGK
jgi:ribosomal protein L24E